jgi:chromosome segregation ATPase
LPDDLTVEEFEPFGDTYFAKDVDKVKSDSAVGKVLLAVSHKQNQIMKQVERNVNLLNRELIEERNAGKKLKSLVKTHKKDLDLLQTSNNFLDNKIESFNHKFDVVQNLLEQRNEDLKGKILILDNCGDSQSELVMKLQLAESYVGELGSKVIFLESKNEYLADVVKNKKNNLLIKENEYNRNLQEINNKVDELQKANENLIEHNAILEQDKTDMYAEYEKSEEAQAELIAKFADEKNEFLKKIEKLQIMVMHAKRARLFQSFSSASQGIFTLLLPSIISRPLNTIIQVNSGMTFLGLVGDCSGLMFFLVLFIMV